MGYRVREIREQKKMSQEELEQKSGISRQTISAIENDKAGDVKVGTLRALANALETTIDNLFFEKAV
jgi:transcriptional regulator with XRE-family HTH domain